MTQKDRAIFMKLLHLMIFFSFLSPLNAIAEVRLSRLFTDNMVLQQDSANTVWGWANPQEKVLVSANWGATASTTADGSGCWKTTINTPSHGFGYTISVTATNTIRIHNVAIGEVWLCAGQSNMGWSVGNSFGAENESTVDLPNFRIFNSQREHWHEPLKESRDRLQRWKPCTPQSALETSAVSYWFGKTLHRKLGVPVGIIVQAYAGTPIEGWMPWDLQKSDPRAIEHRAALDQAAQRSMKRGETKQAAVSDFKKVLAEYNQKIDAGETMKNPFRALQPPFITKPASLGHQYPAHIFNAMIHPIRPYGMKGMIWYQGERNSKNIRQAAHYRQQLEQLIHYYRTSWNSLSDGNVSRTFPFQCTQLPSWKLAQSEAVEGSAAPWAVNRESMRLVSRDVPNVGMVVSIDTGDEVELHPKNKKPIGIRHALLALEQTYQQDVVGQGPQYRRHHIKKDGTIAIDFDSVGEGLRAAHQSKPLNAFAIAGNDKKWFWADADFHGTTVVVSSIHVAAPVAVRYAWAMNPSQRNLIYNEEGLPASPFRTDTWPLWKQGESITEVSKPAKPAGYQAVDWERPAMPQAATD